MADAPPRLAPERHLARLGARARPAGSAAAAEARAYCADVLRAVGFVVTERSFEYSYFSGGYATPIAGVVASLCGIGLYVGRRTPPVAVGAALVLAVALGVLGWVGGRGVLDFPALRRAGVNLEAVRGDEPRVWLVAHVDSKWQPVSMIARVVGVLLTVAGLVSLGVLAIVRPADREGVAALALVLTWLGTTPLMLSVVGDHNAGTLDNASGVAAVLEAAESIPAAARVGVMLTDAEELGLAGARAWVRARGRPSVALNCDSVDDTGRLTVMYSGSAPQALLLRCERAALAQGVALRSLHLIPGILTDSVPLAAAGWETVTLSRGNLRTLGRIHTRRDSPQAMRGTGIAEAADMLSRIATELG